MRLHVDLAVPEGADPIAVADWVLNLLCNQGDDAPYESCDNVEAVAL